jgi:hypothetical protein
VTWKLENFFSISKDFGGVFHEESAYVIGFIIRVDKNALSFLVFDLGLCENRVKIKNNYYQNTQRKILYKP